MRKIFFNHSRCKSSDLKQDILRLYKIAYKVKGLEQDIYDVLDLSITCYEENYFFPSKEKILENFKTFKLINENFKSESEFVDYIQDKLIEFRDKYRNDKTLEYLSEKNNSKRLNIINEIIQLETEISNINTDLLEISKYDAEELYNKRKNMGEGPITNIEEVDSLIGGFTSGKLMTIAAPPKCFKTSLMINMAYLGVMEYKTDNNTLIITLEISKDELFWKIIMRHAYKFKWSVNIKKILKGMLEDDEKEKLMEIVDDFYKTKKHNIYMIDHSDLQLDSILGFRQSLMDRIREYEIKTIYIDYIQLFKNYRIRGYKDMYEMLNDIVGVLHTVNVSTNVRIGLLSQINREGSKRSEKTEGKFSFHHLAEVNNLERFSYYILTLYSNEELKQSNQVKFQLLAHRDGITIEDPKYTFVLPEYFLIGKNEEINFEKMTYVDEKKIDESKNNELLDIDFFD